MKTITQIFALGLLLTIGACNSEHKHKHEEETTATTSTSETKSHEKGVLSLDNGQRWEANPETTEGVNNMIQLMADFGDKENAEAYKTLSDSLNSEFTTIFKKCTMKGEAHNQLHSFLLPMKSHFSQLASNDLEQCKAAFEELNKHLMVYTEFFQ